MTECRKYSRSPSMGLADPRHPKYSGNQSVDIRDFATREPSTPVESESDIPPLTKSQRKNKGRREKKKAKEATEREAKDTTAAVFDSQPEQPAVPSFQDFVKRCAPAPPFGPTGRPMTVRSTKITLEGQGNLAKQIAEMANQLEYERTDGRLPGMPEGLTMEDQLYRRFRKSHGLPQPSDEDTHPVQQTSESEREGFNDQKSSIEGDSPSREILSGGDWTSSSGDGTTPTNEIARKLSDRDAELSLQDQDYRKWLQEREWRQEMVQKRNGKSESWFDQQGV